MGVPRNTLLRRVLSVVVRTSDTRRPDAVAASAPPTPRASDFDGFYSAHYPGVVRLAYSLCGSMTIAEELAQEAFATAHGKWRRIATFDRPDLWVRRVVINRSLSYRRRQRSERNALERVSQRRVEPVEPALSDEELWTALRSLSRRQAEVLALVYMEDQSIADVAAILRLSEETVRTHLKRGRRELAARLTTSDPPTRSTGQHGTGRR